MHDFYAVELTPNDWESVKRIIERLRDVGGENTKLFSRIAHGLRKSVRVNLEETCKTFPVDGSIVAISSPIYK